MSVCGMPKHDAYSYPPRGMSREESARYVGVGTTKFDEMVADRRMPKPKRIDGRTVWDRVQLDAAFSDLPSEVTNRIDELLARSTRPQAESKGSETPSGKLATNVAGVAKHWQCSERHVRDLINEGHLPAMKLGGKLIRIFWSDVDAFELSGGWPRDTLPR